nr:bifunctional folylpolyglutamate synthase/dihydrofolate synthase [Saprospiraceae bacterium]
DQYYGQAVVPAMGPFIAENTMISLAAWQVLKDYFKLQGSAFIQGARQLKELTQYQGRWQWLDEGPDILTDSAHNEEGISGVLEAIRALDYPQIHFVLGFVRDKAIEEMLQLFPSTGKYYFVQAKVPRALPAGEVASKAREIGLKGKPYSSVNKGLAAAKQTASSKDLIFVGGSTFVVAEVL